MNERPLRPHVLRGRFWLDAKACNLVNSAAFVKLIDYLYADRLSSDSL